MPIEWRVVYTPAELNKLLGEVEGIVIPDAPPPPPPPADKPSELQIEKRSKSSRGSKKSKKSSRKSKASKKSKPPGKKPKAKDKKKRSKSKSASRSSRKSASSKSSKKSKKAKKINVGDAEKPLDSPPPPWWQGGKFQVQIYILFTVNLADDFSREFQDKIKEVENKINEFLSYLPQRRKILMITVRLRKSMFGIGSELYNDPLFRVFDLPYLMRWRGPQRLYKSECLNPRLLHLFFEDDFKHPNRFRADTDSFLGSLVYPPTPSPTTDDVTQSVGTKASPKGKDKKKKKSKGKKSTKSEKSSKKGKKPKKK